MDDLAAIGAAVDEMYAMISGPRGPRDWSRQANCFHPDARQVRTWIDAEGRRRAIGLLEVQEHAMLMYTSCGWFFDDISGLEAVFVLRHAGWACQLAREFIGVDLEPELMARLERAPSNLEGVTGRVVYEREVSPFVGRR